MAAKSAASNLDRLKPYLDEVREASKRARWTLFVLVTITIVIFSASWNARKGSWIYQRQAAAHNALTWLRDPQGKRALLSLPDPSGRRRLIAQAIAAQGLVPLGPPSPVVPQAAITLRVAALDASAFHELSDDAFKAFKQTVSDEQQKELDEAREFIRAKQIRDETELTKLIEGYARIVTDQVIFFRVPMFGTAIDVNDLGMLGGFSFVVVLLMLRFSLAREYANLVLAFEQVSTGKQRAKLAAAKQREELAAEQREKQAAKQQVRKLATAEQRRRQELYDLLSMSQVLTVPPPKDSKASPTLVAFWSNLHKVLFFLPLLVQLTVIINDIRSFELGFFVSPTNTRMVVLTSLVFLALIVVLTYQSVKSSRASDREWNKQRGLCSQPAVETGPSA